MSRIAGMWGAETAQRRSALVDGMVDVLPTSSNWKGTVLQAGRAALAWTGWRQPTVARSDDGAVAVVDGYVYNLDEIEGSPADAAAAVLSLYRRYGFEDAMRRLNADVAIALYDPVADVLWLGADRVGTRPLFYSETSEGVFFASQARALLTVPGVSRRPNTQFVALFAASHYRLIDNDLTASPYADIRRIQAGHVLRFSRGSVRTSCYWALQDLPDHTAPEAELAETYCDLLFDAVRRRLHVADRPAFTLSGGMDSSSVLASAVRLTGQKQSAFTVGYVDRTYDESDEARAMVAPAVSDWHQLIVDVPDVFGLIKRMVAVHDEPVATATWLSHFVMCEDVARRGFGSLFGGLGGDELNAGEYEHFWCFFADLKVAGEAEKLAHEVRMWAQLHDHPIFRKSPEIMEQNLGRLVDMATPGRCLPDRQRLERYLTALNPDYFDLKAFQPVMEHPFRSYLKNRTYQDMTREPIPCCLRGDDRHTMAFGLDNFSPFFDHRLIEFMFRVPGTMKFRNGVTKHLLREAMKGVLPDETRTRSKKAGFNAPAHIWFSGKGRTALLDLVHSGIFRERGIYNIREVLRLADEHEEIVSSGQPRDNHMMFFWQLANLEIWLQSVDFLDTAFGARKPMS